jgi:MFS family permease
MVANYLNALRRFSRDVRLYLLITSLIGFSVFGGIYSVLFNLYLLRMGYGPEFVGLVNASGLLAIVAFSLPAGTLSGRWGTRRMMIAGLCLMVTGYGLSPLPMPAFAPDAAQRTWILAANLLGGLGIATYLVNGSPFMMGATGPEERAHAFSMQGALSPLAGFAGSLVGGWLPGVLAPALGVSLDGPAPYRYALLIATVAMSPAVLAMLATRETGPARTEETATPAGPAPYGLIALMALVVLLQAAGEGAARTFFNVYLDAQLHVPTPQIGALFAVGQLLAAPAALTAPLLMARWGRGRTYVLASLGVALSLLPLALVPHWSAAGLGFVGLIALASIARPIVIIYQQEAVSPAWRSAMASGTTMGVGLSWFATALGGGHAIAALGYPSLFLTGAALTTSGALLFWAHLRASRGRLTSHPADD